MRVIGYTADADTWCVSCARATYGDDQNGRRPVYDREGNMVHPIFSTDEHCDDVYCRRCGGFIAAGHGHSETA